MSYADVLIYFMEVHRATALVAVAMNVLVQRGLVLAEQGGE
jgi:hypothetical protein